MIISASDLKALTLNQNRGLNNYLHVHSTFSNLYDTQSSYIQIHLMEVVNMM